jgi:ketosteroid isomerase-like protein
MVTDHASFAAAVRALDEAFARHANAGGADQLAADCYADDAAVLPPNAPLVQGRGQVAELFRELLEAEAGDVVRETTPLHVAGDLGYGVGRYAFIIRGQGTEPVRKTGKHLLVYRRQANGAWKIAADMFSSDLPTH